MHHRLSNRLGTKTTSVCLAVGLGVVLSSTSVLALGPHDGGVLLINNPEIVYCSDDFNYCGESTLRECDEINSTEAVDGIPSVWFVYAAFHPTSNPRLAGVTFGLDYDDSTVFLVDYGACGDFVLSLDDWPAPNSGTAVTWNEAQLTHLTEVYWFAGYEYYGASRQLALKGHATGGGNFADDDIPSNVDAIAAYGALGFNGDPGAAPCPFPPTGGACCFESGNCRITTEEPCVERGGDYLGNGTVCIPYPCDETTGACCFPDGRCEIRTENECDELGGQYAGFGIECNPNPCVPVPTLNQSWGEVKASYR